MQVVKTAKKTAFADYGIDLYRPDFCPRCEQTTLVVEVEKEMWHCESRNCQWRGRLGNSLKSQIMDASEAAPSLIRWHTAGPPEGMSYGWPSLDEFIKAVRGEWTLLTGYSSHGKSHLMDATMINMAVKGWKFAMYSPENTPYERHVKGLAQKLLGKRFSDCDVDEIRFAVAFLKEHFYFIEPAEPTLESVIAQFWKLAKEKKVQGCVIDPWNEVEHAVPLGMTETQYTARALIKWRRFCEAAHVHGWIVAHPSKIQTVRKEGDTDAKRPVVRLADVSGSSHFENKCFFGVSVRRNPTSKKIDDQGHDERHVNEIYILKARNEDAGKVGLVKLVWDPKSTGYYEHGEVGMGRAHGEDLKERFDKLGGWRKHPAVRRPKEQEDLKARLAEWKNEGGTFRFTDGHIIATVTRVEGPGEIVWEACIKQGGKLDQEKPWAVKEEAMDWCEQQVMAASNSEGEGGA